jgi:hypothetical protein
MIAYLEDKFGERLATLHIEEFRDNRLLGTILNQQFPDEVLALFAEFQDMVDSNSLRFIDEPMRLIDALDYRVWAESFDESRAIYDVQIFLYDNKRLFSFYIETG